MNRHSYIICCSYIVVVLQLWTCISSASSLPYINDDQFNNILNSDVAFGVVPLIHADPEFEDNSDKTLDFSHLEQALVTLQHYDVQLYLLNCQESSTEICKSDEAGQSINLFQYKRHVHDLEIVSLTSRSEVEGHILHWLNTSLITHVKSSKQWIQLMNVAKKNIFLVFSPSLGSKLHNFALRAALEYRDRIQFAYITIEEVAGKLGLDGSFRNSGEIWLAMCDEGLVNSTCITASYLNIMSASYLNQTLQEMLMPTVVKVDASTPVEDMKSIFDAGATKGLDSLVFTAESQKREKAFLLARKACALLIGRARCFFLSSDSDRPNWIYPVDRNRIYLSIIPHEEDIEDIEVGYLLAETPTEVYVHWRRLEPLRRVKRLMTGAIPTDLLNDEDENSELDPVLNQQDDPVAYSVHNNKALHDLYLFDYKTLPRLSDVTYDDVIKSDGFAVVLFTLEFNAKALAVLSHYWNIHQEFKDEGAISPLHRVECFDWPDVCSKANISTFPRMFFYRGTGDERHSIEYAGIWSPSDMKKAIVLSSLSRPVDGSNDVPDSINEVVYGLISTDDGEAVFRSVAENYGHQYAFKLVGNSSEAKTMSAKIGWDWPQKDGLMALSSGEYLPSYKLFTTADDIINFMTQAFRKNVLPEMTASNYQEYIASSTSLFIQFKRDDADEINQALTTIVEEIRSEEVYADKADFVWMNSSLNTAGEYALHMYSGGRNPRSSLVFLSKKDTASVLPFEEAPTKAQVVEWVALCLSGNAPVDFHFLNDRRSPRMESYDYLRYVQEEGKLPMKERPSVVKNDDAISTKQPEKPSSSSASMKHTEL